MRNSIFCVDDEPYCVWDPDLASQTKDFLKGLDPEFFDYSIEAHLKTEDEKRASVALRLTLHHSLETFFSLVGAYVQAHDCPYAWISKAQTKNIRSVTEKICSGNSKLFTKLKVDRLTWPSVASLVFSQLMPDTDRQRSIIVLIRNESQYSRE